MRFNYRHFPHPVLFHLSDDILDSFFDGEIQVTKITENIILFSVEYNLENTELKSLIDSGDAKFAFHIECPTTRFRRLFYSSDIKHIFEINTDYLEGTVEACPLILSNNELPSYYNSSFNPDYNGKTFKVMKGDILAVGKEKRLQIDKKIDPLRNVSSILTVTLNNSKDAAPFDVDFGTHRIVVKLSKENFEVYKTLMLGDTGLQSVLASIMVIPPLVSIIEEFKEGSTGLEEYEELRWFRVLKLRLNELGIDIYNPDSFEDSSVQTANKLIGDPFSSSLKVLEEYESEE